MTLTKKYVIDLLKDYKRLVLHRETVSGEYDALKAKVITDMPIASGLSNPIEQMLEKIESEKKEIEAEIKIVNGWLTSLSEIEQFVLREFYFEERYYYEIADMWYAKSNRIYSRLFWVRKRERAIHKIVHHTKNPRKQDCSPI